MAEGPFLVELTGPGPFELPRCTQVESVGTGLPDTVLLHLRTEEPFQVLVLPIATQALASLKRQVDHLIGNLGLGAQTRQ